MSEDSYTEITSQSWGNRLGDSFKGIIVGIILFIAAFPLLFWNEGRAVNRYKALKEGESIVISVSADDVDSDNEGKLVHLTGNATTDENLTDKVFGISVNAIKLKRIAKMYQWKETSKSETTKKVGGGTTTKTTYTYSKVWSERLINSSRFKKPEGHQNPGRMRYDSTEFIARKVTLGDFKLSKSLINKINNYSRLVISADSKLTDEIKGKATINNGMFYFGNDPADPVIGDVQVSFMTVTPTVASIVSRQVKDTFEPYHTQTGSGKIELLQIGTHSAKNMFSKAHDENETITWILRIAGFLMMFIGLSMIFKPLSVMGDVIPIIGNIIGFGTGIVAFLLAAALSLITMAIAWIIYRPVLGAVMLFAAVALAFFAGKVSKGKARRARTALP